MTTNTVEVAEIDILANPVTFEEGQPLIVKPM